MLGPCPLCSGELQVKTARNTGKKFVGCTNFPDCKFTSNVERYRTSIDVITSSLIMEETTMPLFRYVDVLDRAAQDSANSNASHLLLVSAKVIRILATYLLCWRRLEDPSTVDAVDRVVSELPDTCKNNNQLNSRAG